MIPSQRIGRLFRLYIHLIIALFVINIIAIIYLKNNTRIEGQLNGFFDHIDVICEKTFLMIIPIILAHMVTLFVLER